MSFSKLIPSNVSLSDVPFEDEALDDGLFWEADRRFLEVRPLFCSPSYLVRGAYSWDDLPQFLEALLDAVHSSGFAE